MCSDQGRSQDFKNTEVNGPLVHNTPPSKFDEKSIKRSEMFLICFIILVVIFISRHDDMSKCCFKTLQE